METSGFISYLLRMHSGLLNTLLLLFLTTTVWGVVSAWLGQRTVSPNYSAMLTIGELLLVTEAVIGALLWFADRPMGNGPLHLLYAAVALLIVPGTYLYLRRRPTERPTAIYALACLFLCLILLRALSTGRVGA